MQIESSYQNYSITHTEPMDIDGSEELQEATQFLAMLEAGQQKSLMLTATFVELANLQSSLPTETFD